MLPPHLSAEAMAMGNDFHIKFAGVEGESRSKDHKG